MLSVTPEAGMAIVRLTADQGAPIDGGLRVEMLAVDDQNFAVSVAPMPDEQDQVVTEQTTGARVLLDPLTAERLDDTTLDVQDTIEGTPQFRLTR